MPTTIKVRNGPTQIVLEEVVIGSQLEIAAFVERKISEDPDVWQPFDFTGHEVACHIKDNTKSDIAPDAVMTAVPRIGQPGWIDLHVDGTITGTFTQRDYEASLKVWPVGQPQNGDTVLVILMPVKWRATR